MSTPITTAHAFREVGYQLPRERDSGPLVPDPAFAGLFPVVRRTA